MKECDNYMYRGIVLVSVPEKVFCLVNQRRLAKRAEHAVVEDGTVCFSQGLRVC